jgi:hypothetical protein
LELVEAWNTSLFDAHIAFVVVVVVAAAAAECAAALDVHGDGGNYTLEDPWLLELS